MQWVAPCLFEWALSNACLSHYVPGTHESYEAWETTVKTTPVRIQWDPERTIRLGRLDHRSIQIGLRGEAIRRYVNDWTVQLEDLTERCHSISELVRQQQIEQAQAMLPIEEQYPVPEHLCAAIGISRNEVKL